VVKRAPHDVSEASSSGDVDLANGPEGDFVAEPLEPNGHAIVALAPHA
jgi:hypothetical protein